MDAFSTDVFAFVSQHAEYIVIVVCALIFIESLAYIFFPRQIKKAVQLCPVKLMRIAGVMTLILSVILLLLYIRMLKPMF